MTTVTEPPAGAAPEAAEGKGLKDGAIGFLSNTVIAIASVAPAYSLAAALGFVVLGRRAALADRDAAGVLPDDVHRRWLRRAQQGHARLRHHLHLGDEGVRAQDRVDGRLGHRRR